MLDSAIVIKAARTFRDRFEGHEAGTANGALLDIRDGFTKSGNIWENRPCVFIRSTPSPQYELARLNAEKAAQAAIWALTRPLHTEGLPAVVIEQPEEFSKTPEYLVSEIAPGIFGAWINITACQDLSQYKRVHQAANTAAADWTNSAKKGTWSLLQARYNGVPTPSYDVGELTRGEMGTYIHALLTRKGIC